MLRPGRCLQLGKRIRYLGYKPKAKFVDGVNKVHEWFVENWDNIQESAEF